MHVRAADYRDIVQVSDPQLSPDGDRVAFVRKVPEDDEDYEATVYVVPVDGGDSRRFTLAEGVDGEPRWSPSGERLAFVSTRGADDDRPQLWIVPADGGEARQVTDVAGDVSNVAWSPDGERLAFTQQSTPEEREEGYDLDAGEYEREDPDPRVIDRTVYRSMERYFDRKRSHVYVVDCATDAVERVTEGEHDFGAPEWGDARTLYYTTKRRAADPDDSIEHDVVAYDTERDEETVVTRTTGWLPDLAATADGRVAHTYTPEEKAAMRQTEVRVYDRETGETATPTERLDRTVAGSVAEGGIEWNPDGTHVYFLTPDEGHVTLRRVRGEADAGTEVVVEEGALTGFSVGAGAVAVVRSEWNHRGDVFLCEGDAVGGGEEGAEGAEADEGEEGEESEEGEVRRLTDVNADYLAEREVGEPEELRFESEGREIQGWVLTPPGFDPDGTYPLAVEVHGGPHAMWTTSGTMWHEFQTLAARGYVVFWCNPRGSVGYGEEFAMAIERDWGAVTMRDVLAGVDRVAERGYVDPDDAFLTGGSFGGYMTSWIVGHTDRFRAAVAQRGVYDLLGFYGSTDAAYRLVEDDFGALPWADPEFLWKHSPAAYADEVETPTLVIHADDDFRVPVNNAELLHRFFRKNGVETRLVRYPREGHELSRSGEPAHVVDRLERIARWFDGYSDRHDAPRALERGDEGLSAAEGDGRDGG